MDQMQALEIAKRYLKSVSEKYQIKNAILFGSHATGTNNPDSDIDIAIIFESVDDIFDMQIELMRLRSDDDLFIEPHPFTKEDFQATNPIVSEIMKKGIEIMDYAV